VFIDEATKKETQKHIKDFINDWYGIFRIWTR
jgi:DNA phosphorothioation-dependent restriction protein DptG